MILAILGFVCGIVAGLLIYHQALSSAGWLGRKAADQAEKQLKKAGRGLLGIEEKPGGGTRSRNRYGRHYKKKED